MNTRAVIRVQNVVLEIPVTFYPCISINYEHGRCLLSDQVCAAIFAAAMATPGALDSNGVHQHDVERGQVEVEVKEGEEPPTMSDKLFMQQLGPYRKEPTVLSSTSS